MRFPAGFVRRRSKTRKRRRSVGQILSFGGVFLGPFGGARTHPRGCVLAAWVPPSTKRPSATVARGIFPLPTTQGTALVALATLAKPTLCTVAAPAFQLCVHPRQPQNHIGVAFSQIRSINFGELGQTQSRSRAAGVTEGVRSWQQTRGDGGGPEAEVSMQYGPHRA